MPKDPTDYGQIVGWFETADEAFHRFIASPIPTSAATELRANTLVVAGIPDYSKLSLPETIEDVLLRMAVG